MRLFALSSITAPLYRKSDSKTGSKKFTDDESHFYNCFSAKFLKVCGAMQQNYYTILRKKFVPETWSLRGKCISNCYAVTSQ